MNVAASVRKEKEQYPERFCPVKGCLWRTQTHYGYKPCETHPIRTCVVCQGAIVFPASCHWEYNHETDERAPHCAECARAKQRSEVGAVSGATVSGGVCVAPRPTSVTPSDAPTACSRCEGTLVHCRECGRCCWSLTARGMCHRCDLPY